MEQTRKQEEKENLLSKDDVACVACSGSMGSTDFEWVRKCQTCNFLSSTLWDETTWEVNSDRLEESIRQAAFSALRNANAEKILDELEELSSLRNARLLDVGCGPGWFLSAANKRGLQAVGVEPLKAVADDARLQGCTVIEGFFPECLRPTDKFDLITFNDVLEHLPSVDSALRASHKHLCDGGLLSVAIPSSKGVFYRIANVLAKFGYTAPIDRMWQKGFYTPHLSYFDDRTLELCMKKYGFTLLKRDSLPSMRIAGLWNRLRIDRANSVLSCGLIWIATAMISPFLALLPADVIFHVYRKEEKSLPVNFQ